MAAKRRTEPGTDVLYGRNPVREALRGRRRVLEVWTSEPERYKRLEAEGAGTPMFVTVSRAELEQRCGSREHQGVACAVEPYPYADALALLDAEQAVVVALDQVQDPQNLGAICRAAECAGAAGVVVPERRSADVTAAVCRASAGAVEHLRIARVRNLADFFDLAKEKGAWVYGADAAGSVPYTQPDYKGRTVLVLGGEASGLRPRVKAACDQLLAIPLHGAIGSLNVSAAAAILLYEAVRSSVDPAQES